MGLEWGLEGVDNNEIWVWWGEGCVLIVGDKIDETCVLARIENWKNM